MKLKDAQIELIEKDLRRKGITYDPLHEDLVDHVCSEIEERMEKGESFRNAYDRVMDFSITTMSSHSTPSILRLIKFTASFAPPKLAKWLPPRFHWLKHCKASTQSTYSLIFSRIGRKRFLEKMTSLFMRRK